MVEPVDLPPALRRYLLAVSVIGPATAIALTVAGPSLWNSEITLWAVLLTGLALAAERFPLHLTHKTNVNVATVAYVAMILLLPASLPGILALLAVAGAQLLKRADPAEGIFNSAQTALYVSLGALCYDALRDLPLAPPISRFGGLIAVALASVVLHLTNTGLVAGAVSLQLRTNPVRVWIQSLPLDLTEHLILTALGIIAAQLAIEEPLVLLFLTLPTVLVYHALRQTIRLRKDTQEALAALVDIIELRDPYTAGHSRRVAKIAHDLALRIGLTAEEADLIELAAQVHDLGKAALDTTILRKPGKLNEDEWKQVRLHPIHSADIVARFAAYRHSIGIVRHHHERWDGKGYPDGLAGEEIPLGARILAVADTFDALTSDRPYRRGMSVGEAIAILEQDAGSQWDPRLVEVFVAYLRESNATLSMNQSPLTAREQQIIERATPILTTSETDVTHKVSQA